MCAGVMWSRGRRPKASRAQRFEQDVVAFLLKPSGQTEPCYSPIYPRQHLGLKCGLEQKLFLLELREKYAPKVCNNIANKSQSQVFFLS
jgi:hypothetical protein